VIVDLIEAGIEETLELYLCDRTNSIDRHAEGHRHDPQLRQGCIHYAVSPEFLLQTVGDTKDAAFFSDVFAKDHNPAVPLQLLSKSQIDCFNHIELRHCYSLSYLSTHEYFFADHSATS
jgi:hypothetical protein